MIDPFKTKYHNLYWEMAHAAAEQSVARRHKVGAILVTATGMISVGWNGMPAGMDNDCEHWDDSLGRYKTNPEVIHAERNAIDKMTRQGISTNGSVLFVTRSPCFECAKALHGLGLAAIHFDEVHDCTRGLALLERSGIALYCRNQIASIDQSFQPS
jgi:dCMP deaminase